MWILRGSITFVTFVVTQPRGQIPLDTNLKRINSTVYQTVGGAMEWKWNSALASAAWYPSIFRPVQQLSQLCFPRFRAPLGYILIAFLE